MEFQIGDRVITTTGHRFMVKGISYDLKGPLYTGENIGWVRGDCLDLDYTEAQKTLMDRLERVMWSLHSYASELERLIPQIRGAFGGRLPPQVDKDVRSLCHQIQNIDCEVTKDL